MAVGLCRISGTRLGKGLEDAKASTACVFGCRGQNRIFIVSLGRQANYPRLLAIGYSEIIEFIFWLDDYKLRMVHLKPYLSCQLNVFELRLASSANNRLPIECNSLPPALPHDSRAVCVQCTALAFASHQGKYGVVTAAILQVDTMDD